MSRKAETLPPGVQKRDGKLVRVVPITAADGSTREQVRQIAPTLAEARERRFDYYHPELGWIREGLKVERVRSEGEIMADASASVGMAPTESEGQQSSTPIQVEDRRDSDSKESEE